jgi:hypothetical protein
LLSSARGRPGGVLHRVAGHFIQNGELKMRFPDQVDHHLIPTVTRAHVEAPPPPRLLAYALTEVSRENDRLTEGALAERERAGTLTPGQIEVLAEIRTRRSIAAGASPPVPIPAAPATQRAETPKTFPNTPDGWKAAYAASADLQREFVSAEAYANYAAGVASGRIRIAGGRTNGARAARSMLSPAKA